MAIQPFRILSAKICRRLTELKGAPRQIALGFSLGLFIGMTPFIGVHLISSILLASFFGWNRISAAIGVNITNVGTAPVIYPINYWVGVHLAGISSDVQLSLTFDPAQLLVLFRKSPLIFADLFVGGVIIGLPVALAGYFIALKTVCFFRKNQSSKVFSDTG